MKPFYVTLRYIIPSQAMYFAVLTSQQEKRKVDIEAKLNKN